MTFANQAMINSEAGKIDPAGYSLIQLVDTSRLQKLFDLQYSFAHLPVRLTDTEENVLVAAGWQDIFTGLRKETDHSSGRKTTNTVHTKNREYKNELGLREYGLAVEMDGKLMGHLQFGPFLIENNEEDELYFKQQSGRLNLTDRQFKQLSEIVPRLTKDRAEQITEYYSALVDMIADQARKNLMEQEDRKNRGFLKSIYDGADMPMFVISVDESNEIRFQSINHAHEKLTGMKSSFVMGKTPEELPGIPPEAANQVRQNYERCLKARKSIQYKEMIPMFGKETHWLTTLTPLKDKTGRIDRIVGTSMFINELVETQRELEAHRKNLEQKVKERTKKLRASEELYALATEATNQGVWDWNLQTNTVYFSPIWKKQIGYKPNELENSFRTWENLLHPEDKEKNLKAVESYLQKPEGKFIVEFRLRHKKGHYIWIHNEAASQKDKTGRVIRMFGAHTDISRRMLAETEREKVLADLQERIKEITCLYNINGLFKKAPEKLDTLLQKAVEIIPGGWMHPGKTSAEIVFDHLSVRSKNFNQSDTKLSENIVIDEVIRGKVTVFLDKEKLDKTAQDFIPEEKSLLGQIAFNLSQYIDKLEYEEALEESEVKFRNIIKYSPLPKVILDLDYKVEFVNESFTGIIGYTKQEVPDIDTWWKTAFPDKAYRDELKNEWDKAMDYAVTVERASDPVEAKITCKNGEIRTFNVIGNKIGEQFVIIFSDLTERIHAQEKMQHLVTELERSNRDLEQFAYVASHDLQEPLRMVSSYTQLLERRYKGKLDDRAGKYIYYAVDGAIRMQHLINDLLEFSRITTRGKEFVPTDVNEVMKTAVKNLEHKIKETRAKVTWDELPQVNADKPQLERLFTNLAGNAVKFRKPGQKPVIHIAAKQEEDHWLFSVKDNGIGISPDFKEKVFVIFQRLHGAGEYPGTGIGLAISKQIVQRHGGEIWYESDQKEGTTFYFTIAKNNI